MIIIIITTIITICDLTDIAPSNTCARVPEGGADDTKLMTMTHHSQPADCVQNETESKIHNHY